MIFGAKHLPKDSNIQESITEHRYDKPVMFFDSYGKRFT